MAGEMLKMRFAGMAAAAAGTLAASAALGQDNDVPSPMQIGLREPVTPVAEMMYNFHNFLLVIITLITLLVLSVMLYVIVRFREGRNPTPSNRTHNTWLEVLWTIGPVIILIIIAVPSFRLLYFEDVVPEDHEMTVTVTGHQWHWEYEYDDFGDFSYLSFMLDPEEIDPAAGEYRQRTTDAPLVLPVDTTIRFRVTGADVMHNFGIPSFGIKQHAIPGRVNETWARVQETGTYYGYCNELCGANHDSMPVHVEVVSQDAFNDWVEEQQAARGIEPSGDVRLAAAE